MKILLTGINGQVGYELMRTLTTLGNIHAPNRRELDLSDADSIRNKVREVAPDLIVNPAAFTAVDKAEESPELAMAINGIAPGILAEEAKALDAAIIHYSTDYVFDGQKKAPYIEDDTPNPINEYGRSKLAGEEAIRAVDCRHLILRTSWVYSNRGSNFLLTMLRLAHQREELGVVNDQVGSPTWSRMLAEITAQILAQQVSHDKEQLLGPCSGTYHATSTGSTSWYNFAKSIFEMDPNKSDQTLTTLTPIASENYPTPAIRPKHSVMSTNKIQQTFNLRLPDWSESLSLALS